MPPTTEQLVVFRAAGELYALPVADVREVLPHGPWRRLPSAARPWVVGVVAVRGAFLPVVDLATRLGLPGGDDEGALLVVLAGDGSAVVPVEKVDRLATVDAGALSPAPGYAGDAAVAVAELDGVLVVVLRAGALVPEPR